MTKKLSMKLLSISWYKDCRNLVAGFSCKSCWIQTSVELCRTLLLLCDKCIEVKARCKRLVVGVLWWKWPLQNLTLCLLGEYFGEACCLYLKGDWIWFRLMMMWLGGERERECVHVSLARVCACVCFFIALMIDKFWLWSNGGWRWQEKVKIHKEKPVLLQLCPPQAWPWIKPRLLQLEAGV